MTRREYDSWIRELSNSSDSDIREIAEKASRASWYLDNYFPCNRSFTNFSEFYPGFCSDSDEFRDCIKAGWITFHGPYAAVWADGLI